MRHLALLALLIVSPIAAAEAHVSVGISLPGISIGINQPAYPQLVLVPGYPVYYDPRYRANYFFYDGMYWVFFDDNWYASSWYDGPWHVVAPAYVPYYVLRVPVRYYRAPPAYFHGWRRDEPPRWNERWGRDWEERRSDWYQRNVRPAPPPAPLPAYQRQYVGAHYPREPERQQAVRREHYRYEPREEVVRQHWQQQAQRPQQRQSAPPAHGNRGKAEQHANDHSH